MTSTLATRTPLAPTRSGLFPDLEHPRQVSAHFTPNWFAAVMGTGIVAVAATSLPVSFPGLRVFATGMWLLAAILLISASLATAAHWRRHPRVARGHLTDPVMGHFYGAPPMAVLTVGAGTLLLGPDLIGLQAAVTVDIVLWVTGTVAGLVSAVLVPYLLISRRRLAVSQAFGGWLMSVVPPMVSASTGALLLPHLPSEALRTAMLVGCYAMFAFSLLASVAVYVVLGHRLIAHPAGPARMAPTLWIGLGPLGQSVTAVGLLAGAAGNGYGVVVLGVAMLWLVGAASTVARTAHRHGLPFSLTWWSFTFPVGTCATAANGLALHTGAAVFEVAAVALFVLLVSAWCVVGARTVRGCHRGFLFLPPVSPGPARADVGTSGTS